MYKLSNVDAIPASSDIGYSFKLNVLSSCGCVIESESLVLEKRKCFLINFDRAAAQRWVGGSSDILLSDQLLDRTRAITCNIRGFA